MKTNYTFKDIAFTTAARQFALEKIAQQKQKDRKYLEQALAFEFGDTESIGHQYMTLADVIRVLKTFKHVDEKFRCTICKKLSPGFGNNPSPVKKTGVCCDKCNAEKVIPARIKNLKTK